MHVGCTHDGVISDQSMRFTTGSDKVLVGVLVIDGEELQHWMSARPSTCHAMGSFKVKGAGVVVGVSEPIE